AILYVLQYLGFQEVSMPMHREHPVVFMEFSEPRVYTLIAMGLLVAGVVVSLVIENSRFGLALLAIRQNELAAEAAGINARLWKMRSLVVSGMMAAVAGGFYARVLVVVTPDSVFGMLVSAQAVVVTLFGGVASVWGPLIGAAILVPLAETLQAELGTYLPGIQGVVYGIAIIAIILLSPDGLFWTIRDRWFRQQTAPSVPEPMPIPRLRRRPSTHAGSRRDRLGRGGARSRRAPGSVGRGRRSAHQPAASPDGAGAGPGRRSARAAPRRDPGRPGPRGIRRRAEGAGRVAPAGDDDLHH